MDDSKDVIGVDDVWANLSETVTDPDTICRIYNENCSDSIRYVGDGMYERIAADAE